MAVAAWPHLLNKEARKAGEFPVHGFMSSLYKGEGVTPLAKEAGEIQGSRRSEIGGQYSPFNSRRHQLPVLARVVGSVK